MPNELPGEVSAARAAEETARLSRANSAKSKKSQPTSKEVSEDEDADEKTKNSATTSKSTSDSNLAAWPAWPATRCNTIDPVTLKIAEKTDVACLQDTFDVKALPTYKTEKQQHPEFKVPENIDHATTSAAQCSKFDHKFAPAYVDFAYSGYPGYYGCADARANQIDVIDLKEKLVPHSKFNPLPEHIQENVENKTGLPCQAPRPVKLKVSESLESLERTIDGLREPLSRPKSSKRVKISESFENGYRAQTANADLLDARRARLAAAGPGQRPLQLPPLWETLEYTSDRVIDQLGVKFKSVAQARYHEQFPESRTNQRSTPFPNIYLKQDDRHTTYRRQYYNGNHMGSSFR